MVFSRRYLLKSRKMTGQFHNRKLNFHSTRTRDVFRSRIRGTKTWKIECKNRYGPLVDAIRGLIFFFLTNLTVPYWSLLKLTVFEAGWGWVAVGTGADVLAWPPSGTGAWSLSWRLLFLLHNSWQSCHVGKLGIGILRNTKWNIRKRAKTLT